jgi:hypothetical protein
VLRRILGPKREDVAGGWGRLHNEELHDLYASLNIVRVTKSGWMRWAVDVARVEAIRNTFLSGNLKGKGHSEDQGIDGKITLERILGD